MNTALVEDFEQAVQFYRDRLGLAVVEEGQRLQGHGVILSPVKEMPWETYNARPKA